MFRAPQCAALCLVLVCAGVSASPTVYPTGTTLYDPTRTWNGYTVLAPLGTQAVIVIDMNGNIVKSWEGYNDSAGGPARILPGGQVIAATGARAPHQESLALEQRDFAGNVLWHFVHNVQLDVDGKRVWSLRQHHDWQRSDFPAGYYSPEATPGTAAATTLVLTHISHTVPEVADVALEDDRLIEISGEGKILWQWVAGEHIGELGLDAAARAAIKPGPPPGPAPGAGAAAGFDWLHLNAATYLGPNHWFDEGDARFNPQNVLISSRQASVLAIVARSGAVVWRLGPDYSQSQELKAIGQVIGQHHAHLIPKGLPGAGNLLVFDNGGASGYGFTSPIAPRGVNALVRPYSRVLEINPLTLELVWSYQSPARFYGSNISGAQRLPNGDTLITEGPDGRVFEVAHDGTVIWEYIYPLAGGPQSSNAVYRAYRLPYGWIPQLTHSLEKAVVAPKQSDFRVP